MGRRALAGVAVILCLLCGCDGPLTQGGLEAVPPLQAAPPAQAATAPQPTSRCSLCGREGSRSRPVAVAIDNAPRARPQSGLTAACHVHELPVEGGLTRLLAVFACRDAPVGPVRSVRHYFLDIAAEYGAAVGHVGASPQAFAELARGGFPGLTDLDELTWGRLYLRRQDRRAPHNCYTHTARLRAAAGAAQAADAPQGRDGSPPWQAGQPVRYVSLCWPGAAETIAFSWDAVTGRFLRLSAGVAWTDEATGGAVGADTVLIRLAAVRPLPGDGEGRLEVDLTGSGTGWLCARGEAVPIRWVDPGRAEPCRYLTLDGAPLTWSGTTWFVVAPLNSTVGLEQEVPR